MKTFRMAILLFIGLTVVAGVIYPGIVTIIGQLAFPRQAMGSLVQKADGAPAGSLLIGQPFSDPKYFWSRPSATADFPYNPLASGGSNLGPTNPELLKQVADRVGVLKNSGLPGSAPADLVTASGSGLDPHISLESALLQVYRVARGRGLPEDRLRRLVQEQAEGRQWGFLGVDRVNVVRLNLALDNLR